MVSRVDPVESAILCVAIVLGLSGLFKPSHPTVSDRLTV